MKSGSEKSKGSSIKKNANTKAKSRLKKRERKAQRKAARLVNSLPVAPF